MAIKNIKTYVMSVIVLFIFTANVWASEEITGFVFQDINRNGTQDLNEQGIEDILISNGIDIVKTDQKGNFSLKRVGHLPVFIIKPSGYQLSTSNYGQPFFYEGPNTNQIVNLQFGLFKQDETTNTDVVLLGDLQSHNIDEVYYSLRTSIDELKKTTFDFSLALGDIIANQPVLFPLIKQVISTTGQPTYYTFGNHDLDWDFPHENGVEDLDIDFIKTLGPTYYAMSWGNTNILSINNINVKWNDDENIYDYDYFMDQDQLAFIKNYFSHLNKNNLLIVASHAKPDLINNKTEFYDLFQGFSKVLFVFGHWHGTENYKITKEQGWPNETPAHCIDAGAVCGGWWRGEEDMFGMPSSIMRDGTPKGYVFLQIDSTGNYNLRYKASAMPSEKQMHIYSPDYLTWDENFQPLDPTSDNFFYVNIYLGGEETEVKCRVDGGEWITMQKVLVPDPFLERVMMKEKLGIYPTEGTTKLNLTNVAQSNCRHLWKAACPSGLSYGVHELEIYFSDPYIQNSSQKHGFLYLSPELKEINAELNKSYKDLLIAREINSTIAADGSFTVPTFTNAQKLQRANMLGFNNIIAGIDFAKSQGISIEEYAKYQGEKWKTVWDTAAGFEGLVDFVIRSNLAWAGNVEILNQSDNSITIRTSQIYPELIDMGELLGVTHDELMFWLKEMMAQVCDYLGCSYSPVPVDDGNEITVAKK